MTNSAPGSEVSSRAAPAASRAAIKVATGFGLGYVPWAPGTAASLGAAGLFALVQHWLDGTVLQFIYLLLLASLALLALWSTENALPAWNRPDPRPIVIDELLGQWLGYGGLLVAALMGLPQGRAGAGWKSLLAGFILFRAFDVAKPFPIRRSERLPGAAGVVLDDVLAGIYAALGLLVLAWRGWLA